MFIQCMLKLWFHKKKKNKTESPRT